MAAGSLQLIPPSSLYESIMGKGGANFTQAAWAGKDEEAARLCSVYPDAGAYVLALRLHGREWGRWLEAAADAAQKIDDQAAKGRHLGNLGLAYSDLGEVPAAIDFYQRALAIAQEIGDRRGEGNHLGNLGLAYSDLGEVPKAIDFYQRALAIAQEIGDRGGEGNHLFNMGLALDELGDREHAIERVEAALDVYEEIKSPHAEQARAQLEEWKGEGR